MGQVLHGSATTTEAVRRALQRSEESVRVLAAPNRRLLVSTMPGRVVLLVTLVLLPDPNTFVA